MRSVQTEGRQAFSWARGYAKCPARQKKRCPLVLARHGWGAGQDHRRRRDLPLSVQSILYGPYLSVCERHRRKYRKDVGRMEAGDDADTAAERIPVIG